jgi:dipeptidase E
MNKHTRVILAGGGGAEDSRPLDEMLASWMGSRGRLLYLPIALRNIRSFESCFEWITGTFKPLAITRISMWTDLADHTARDLEEFDAIYVGGGNTYSLMAQLISSNFDRYLRTYAQEGGIVYGGSAGAVVLGKDIRTVSSMDSNAVGLAEVNCLNLANGYAVWPHYQPGNDALIEEFVQRYHQAVLAISERSGVVVESGRLYSVGFEPSYQFDDGKSEIQTREGFR